MEITIKIGTSSTDCCKEGKPTESTVHIEGSGDCCSKEAKPGNFTIKVINMQECCGKADFEGTFKELIEKIKTKCNIAGDIEIAGCECKVIVKDCCKEEKPAEAKPE